MFQPGSHIAWRFGVRIDDSRMPHPSWALAARVVRDVPTEVVVLKRPGDEIRIRNAEFAGPDTFRHRPVARWSGGWRRDTWKLFHVLVIKRPEDDHSISLFWRDGEDDIECWYIDLTSPLRRTPIGFDFVEHGLDVVVRPDLSSWEWKDTDELEWSVDHGIFTRAEADQMYAEGEKAVERLRKERQRLAHWREWRPDPKWPPATLPDGWDRWPG
jgi:hypothetical protein